MNKTTKIVSVMAGIVIFSGLIYFIAKRKKMKSESTGDVIFSNKMNKFFIEKLKIVSKAIGTSANNLAAIIDFETGGTFDPSIQNNTTGATGLIQFLPSTAYELGTTTNELKKMTGYDQLNYVQKYFQLPYNKNKLKSNLTELYLIVFYPVANGKPYTYKFPQNVYASNPVFHNEKGFFTKADLEKVLKKRYPAAYN